MPDAVFYRGRDRQFRMFMPDPAPPHWYVRHSEPFRKIMTEQFDTAATLTDYREVYKLNHNFTCPNCECLVYNSENYMTLPAWVFEQEREQEYINKMDMHGFSTRAPGHI